jgi:2-C-methyl-D-erythritol 2,4-cyclodiphosphate synthase
MQRIGFGFDSHRFVQGRPLVLGGVRIDHALGLAGHSDADAVIHAIIDAILGAMGEGDIGQLFSDTDPRWKDADSSQLLKQVMALAAKNAFAVGNCDVTIITQEPKLEPYKEPMRDKLSALLNVDRGCISVKAKTNEGMGWIGKGEGLAALAAVLMVGPDQKT